ncbi:hypothetical protein Q73_16235 [Bacillus coahuilensis m2-6]|uniref:Methyltransferase small domain-containing protein n=1 Tax=Bacillus coahuilensis p1.1.43 TaxID=1150625 RepID=A0A147K4Y9_9BACI|nr:tRNA1(Val) (adenine(37)-N6)-methyltransferase [Bacillus coahuilensis]KUP04235.1 hypothetical protein Q73_16235 [Bacillus coahuilensis m2-6]KUP04574.1 hypothetical protein Q75_15220 [Bacillus coahuilensis p1.1.43]
MLKNDERLDYLLKENLRIIQSPSVFSFSLDAVLLANFASVPRAKGKVMDLCTGNGVVPLLLSSKTRTFIEGVEIQERLYDMARRSVEYNELEGQIKLYHGDLKDLPKEIRKDSYDTVTCNPPYFTTSHEEVINPNEHLAIARHEIYCTLDDVMRTTSGLLKYGGKAAFVHRPGRLVDIITSMRSHDLEPKRMQLVYPRVGKEANILLIEGIKHGKPDLKILPPFYIFTGEDYTKEMRALLYDE